MRARSPARCTPAFSALRQHCPTKFRRPVRAIALSAEVEADVARIEAAWAHARETFGKAGPFLFGRFSAADAMFAPVVNRFHTYDVPVSRATRAYMDAVMALPAWKAWIADAEAEPWRIEKYESDLSDDGAAERSRRGSTDAGRARPQRARDRRPAHHRRGSRAATSGTISTTTR